MASQDQSSSSSDDDEYVVPSKAKPKVEEEESTTESSDDEDDEEEEEEEKSTVVLRRPLETKADSSADENDDDQRSHHSTRSSISVVPKKKDTTETESVYANPEPRTSTPEVVLRKPKGKPRSLSPATSSISDRRDKSKIKQQENDDTIYDQLDQSPKSGDPLEELRRQTFPAGTEFRAKGALKAQQDGDLTIRKGEILRFVRREDDDWWCFENEQGEEGLVPINYIVACPPTATDAPVIQPPRLAAPAPRPSILIDAWNRTGEIPSGFVSSDLAPLSRTDKYKVIEKFRPVVGSSNLFFKNLYWNYDNEHVVCEQVAFQKFLLLDECLKIPKVKRDKIEVLCRCVRICLTNETEIISNIHTIRAMCDEDASIDDETEDWFFERVNESYFVEHHPKFLIRTNQIDKTTSLFLLIELSQRCRSKTNGEEGDIGCGWMKIRLDLDDRERFRLIGKSQSYDELLSGGHTDQINVHLDQRYQQLRQDGLRGKLHRRKRARIRFKIESFNDDDDENIPIHHLPTTSMIIPTSLIRLFAFYRNELAFQYRLGLSTKSIESIFLSTFANVFEQPDFLFPFLRRIESKKKFDFQRIRKKYLQIYQTFVYPLLCNDRYPKYNFYDMKVINQRVKLITEQMEKILKKTRIENNLPDPCEIFFDPEMTMNFKVFDNAEISYSLQQNITDKLI